MFLSKLSRRERQGSKEASDCRELLPVIREIRGKYSPFSSRFHKFPRKSQLLHSRDAYSCLPTKLIQLICLHKGSAAPKTRSLSAQVHRRSEPMGRGNSARRVHEHHLLLPDG